MNWLGQWRSRRRLSNELSEEIEAHLAEKVDELVAGGISLDDARRAARREFGNVGMVEDASHDVWAWWVDDVLADVRYGLRALRKNPVFTTVALLTIAIGIGANAAVFTVLNSVLLKPLNYPKPEQLVSLHQVAPGAAGLADFQTGLLLSPAMYYTYAEQNRTFQALGAWSSGTANITGMSTPEQVRTVFVSDGVLQALNVRPVVGRWLLQDDQDPHGPERVMLGYAYWQRRFGSSPTAVGQTIIVDSRPREIVGVMPKGFQIVDADFDVMQPNAFDRGAIKTLAGFGMHGLARLKPGVTIAEANADIARILPLWMDARSNGVGVDGHFYEAWRIAPDVRLLKQEVIGNVAGLLWVVMGTIGVVMLIACANVTNLLLVRVEARQQELALRGALGAGWQRIMRTLLVESEMLALLGGMLGIGLAYAAVHVLVAAHMSNLPRVNDISLDARTLGFTVLLSALSGVLFGIIPAMKYAWPRAGSVLRSEGRGSSASRERHRARNSLVAGQVAMALVLLVSAGLMIRTFDALRHVDPGFTDPAHIQLLRISIPDVLVADPQQVAHIQNEIVDQLKTIQGVQAAGFVSEMPMEGFEGMWDEIFAEDKSYPEGTVAALRTYKYLSPGVLQTTGTKLIAGRDITWSEVYGLRPVVLLSENLARDMWGTPAAAIGKHVREDPAMPWYEVVGVVQDVHEKGVQAAAPAIVYWPPMVVGGYAPPIRTVTFAVRSDRAGSASFVNEIRRAVWSVNSSLPTASERTMQDVYDKSLALTSFTLVMLGIAGAMALALGIIGIYGVMSYTVAQRKREIGIRLALGAQRGDVLQLILSQGMRFTLLGVAVGIAAALGLTRLMSSLLFGVTAHDPVTFAGVSILLILIALLACYIPGRRAIRVDPVVALRYE